MLQERVTRYINASNCGKARLRYGTITETCKEFCGLCSGDRNDGSLMAFADVTALNFGRSQLTRLRSFKVDWKSFVVADDGTVVRLKEQAERRQHVKVEQDKVTGLFEGIRRAVNAGARAISKLRRERLDEAYASREEPGQRTQSAKGRMRRQRIGVEQRQQGKVGRDIVTGRFVRKASREGDTQSARSDPPNGVKVANLQQPVEQSEVFSLGKALASMYAIRARTDVALRDQVPPITLDELKTMCWFLATSIPKAKDSDEEEKRLALELLEPYVDDDLAPLLGLKISANDIASTEALTSATDPISEERARHLAKLCGKLGTTLLDATVVHKLIEELPTESLRGHFEDAQEYVAEDESLSEDVRQRAIKLLSRDLARCVQLGDTEER